MNDIKFTFSDTIAGYVTSYDRESDTFGLKTSDGREYSLKLKSNTYGWIANNLDEPRQWCSGDQIRAMLVPGRYMYNYGIYYPEAGGFTYEVQFVIFMGARENSFNFEQPDWWQKEIVSIGDFYIRAEFGEGQPIDFRDYRTIINLAGKKEADNFRQETDTISRLVYGMASCYLMTGEDRFLEVAEKAPSTCATTCASTMRMKGWFTGTTGSISTAIVKIRSSRSNSATTLMPSRLTSKSTPWPARSRPTGSPATHRY